MKTFIPVIHMKDKVQARVNLDILESLDIKSVFLISHGPINFLTLHSFISDVKKEYSFTSVGANFLDMLPEHTFKDNFPNLDMIWIDDSYVGNGKKIDLLEQMDKDRKAFKGLYFGGVSFKGCPEPDNLELATIDSARHMDILTTSGPGTGISASVEKIQNIAATSTVPIALASGVTLDNVDNFLPYVDYFLVATGISDDFYYLNKEKVKALDEKIQSFEG